MKSYLSSAASIIEYSLIALLPLSTLWAVSGLALGPVAAPSLILISVGQVVMAILLWWFTHQKGERAKMLLSRSVFQSTEQFITLYERSPTPYLTIDRTGAILQFNQAAVRLFQATVYTLGAHNIFDFLAVSDEESQSIIVGKVYSGITIDDKEMRLETIEKEVRYVLLSVYEYEQVDERLVSLVDVSQQKIVDQAKSEFVSLATHQLRTPIAAIRWNVELLEKNLRPQKTEDQARYLVKIERNVLRMISLINDFLNVSKLETGTFATSLEEIALAPFIDSVIDEYSEKIIEKKLRLEKTTTPADLRFTTDQRLLHIFLSNLLSNAVKYSATEGKVAFGYELIAHELVFRIADTGIGIPNPEIKQLFTKFYRASNAQRNQAEGTGLGLYIVKQSVEKLGGSVSVSSEENVQTEFVVRLPYSN